MKHLTPEQLGITKEALDALIWTRKQLASKAIRHYQEGKDRKFDGHPTVFNMNYACRSIERDGYYNCGCVACLGGWMAIHALGMEPKAREYRLTSHDIGQVNATMDTFQQQGDLSMLFYPSRCDANYDDITASQAVRTVDHYLCTGKVNWRQPPRAKLTKATRPKTAAKRKPAPKKKAYAARRRT